MTTLTHHLSKTFYVVINSAFAGNQHTKQNHEEFSEFLTSERESFSFVGAHGDVYTLKRVFTENKEHGFRIKVQGATVLNAPIVEAVNTRLAELDTEYAAWVGLPELAFWA